MSFKVGDRVYVDYYYTSHGLAGWGTVVEPGVYDLSPFKYVRVRSDHCASKGACEKGCDGFPLDRVAIDKSGDNDSAPNTKKCTCSMDAIMTGGCPSNKNLKCPGIK